MIDVALVFERGAESAQRHELALGELEYVVAAVYHYDMVRSSLLDNVARSNEALLVEEGGRSLGILEISRDAKCMVFRQSSPRGYGRSVVK